MSRDLLFLWQFRKAGLGLQQEMVECRLELQSMGKQQGMTAIETKFVDALSRAREFVSSWKTLDDLAAA
jgi:hypothetical protein